MSALGPMMQRAGLLSESQVASAREFASSRQLPFAEGVLELKLADEDAIVAFAASKLLIARVDAKLLARVEEPVSTLISSELAWAHLAMPVSLDAQRNLTVVMFDPTSIAAVKAIAEATGLYVVRAVAGRTDLVQALTQHYGARTAAAFDPGATLPGDHLPPPLAAKTPAATPPPISRTPPRASPPRASPPGSRPPAQRSWNPPLSGPAAETVPLSAEALERFLPQLEAAESRDAVTAAVLDYLSAGFSRVILFVHSRDELRGHDARGADLLVDAVRLVRIPSTGNSMFATSIADQRPLFGPMGQSAIDRALSQALGGLDGNVLVLPITLGTKTPLLVFAHGARNPVDPASVQTLAAATGDALMRLIKRSRGA